MVTRCHAKPTLRGDLDLLNVLVHSINYRHQHEETIENRKTIVVIFEYRRQKEEWPMIWPPTSYTTHTLVASERDLVRRELRPESG